MNTTGRNVTFPIYNADGTLFQNLIVRKSTFESIVMSLGDKITGDVYYKDNTLAVTMQEYIEYEGIKYVLVNPPTIIREGVVSDNADLNGMTKYSFVFYHPMCNVANFPFTDVAVTQSEEKYLSQNKTFSWVGNLFDFVAKINANIASTQWVVRTNIRQYESDGVTETQQWQKAKKLSDVLSFNNVFVSDALKTAYETWEIPFVVNDFDTELSPEYTRLAWVEITSISQTVSGRTSPFFLFIKNLDAVSTENRIYYCKVYNRDVLLLHLIPCKYNDVVGMYDVENSVFYGSDEQVTFEAGDEIGRNKMHEVVFGMPTAVIYDQDGNEFTFRFGQGVGLKNNSRTPKNNKIVTRLSGYGSDGNIPYGYPQIPWYGDPSWDYTIGNDSTNPNSYPIYDGIVGGANVRLIKHPFTRKNLMPSVYSQTVFNKVSPYLAHGTIPAYNQTLEDLMSLIDTKVSQAQSQDEINAYMDLKSVLATVNEMEGAAQQSFADSATGGDVYEGFVRKTSSELIDGYVTGVTGDFEFEQVLDLDKFLVENTDYDPDTKIVDYYDATAPEYPNPIVLDSPSVEIHQFEDIKPRLGDAVLVGVSAYYTPSEVPQYMSVAQVIVGISNRLNTEIDVPNERAAVIALREALIAGETDYSDSKQGGSYNYEASITHDDYFLYVSFHSSIHSFDYVALYADNYPVVWDDSVDDEGNYKQSYFKITLPQLAFDIYACASITEEMKINMRSGDCIGCTFNVQVDWEDYKSVFYDDNGNFDPDGEKRQSAIDRYPYSNQGQITVIVAKDTETFGTLMPNIYQQPKTGDKFVILGISLPTSYITTAEQELDDAMREYMLENNIYHFEYPLKFDEHFLATHTDILSQMHNNTLVRFQYAQEPSMALYIKQITIKFGDSPLPQYDITLTDDVEIVLNQIGQVTDEVSRARVQLSELQKYYQQNIIDIINTKLDKVVDDVCQGRITFQQGLNSLGDAVLSADIRSDTFSQGLFDGRGWKIDQLGNAEFESIRARSFLEVVELLVNRMQAQEGDTAYTDNDQIDRVDKYTSSGTTTYVLSLKEKWAGYITSQLAGNILRGVVNTLAAKDAGVSDETTHNPTYQGSDDGGNKYYTSWMRVVATPSTDNTLSTNQIRVVLYGDNDVPAGKNFEPCELMTVVRWGCALNPNEQGITEAEKQSRIRRQRMYMISVSDGRVVKYTKVNSPILSNANYGVTIGELPEFVKQYTDVARVLSEVGEHTDWLYAQGVVVENFIKVDVNGNPEVQYVDCGEWVNGGSVLNPTPRKGIYLVNEWNETSRQYETNDVWHNGSKWRCLQHQPVMVSGVATYYEPTVNSLYWQLIEGNNIREVSIYKWSDTKPQRPTNTHIPPVGWGLSPNPKVGDKWHLGDISDDEKVVVRIPIVTSVANSTITLSATVSSESDYDFGILGFLDDDALETDNADTIASACEDDDGTYGAFASGETTFSKTYTIATAGSHFICIAYVKDGSVSSGDDCTDVAVTAFSENASKLWKCVGTSVNDVLDDNGWSQPIQENAQDGATQQSIYYRSNTAPATPATSQNDDNLPANWSFTPIDVNASQKNCYISTRTKKDGVWSAYSTPVLFTHYAEDGTSVSIKGAAFDIEIGEPLDVLDYYDAHLSETVLGDIVLVDENDSNEGYIVITRVLEYWDVEREKMTNFTYALAAVGDGYIIRSKSGTASIDGHLFMASVKGEYGNYNFWNDLGRIKGDDGNGIVSITNTYARSSQSSTANDSTPPTIDGSWSGTMPTATYEYPYIWCKEVTTFTDASPRTRYYLQAVLGQRGKVGRFFYYAGEFDSSNVTKEFLVNDAQAPWFKTGNTYHVFDYDVNGSYTMAQMAAIQSDFNYAPWVVMTDDFKYLITEALFGSYAHLGASIINGDWMISQHGTLGGGASTNYQNFDPNLPKGSVYIATNKHNDGGYTDSYTVSLLANRTYRFYIKIDAIGSSDAATLVVNGTSSTVHNNDVVTFTPSSTDDFTVTVTPTEEVSYSLQLALQDAFIPNYAIDMLVGKAYMQNADISGNVSAMEVVAASADMITTVQAGVLRIASTKSSSYGIFAINSLNEVVLQMYDKDGNMVVNLGGTPSTVVAGEWKDTKLKYLGSTPPTSQSSLDYTAYDWNCTTYYQLKLGKMVNSNNVIQYYLPSGQQTTDQSVISKDGFVFSQRVINTSYYIPDGYYIAPNNGIFPQFIPSAQESTSKSYVAVYYYRHGKLENTLLKEFYT